MPNQYVNHVVIDGVTKVDLRSDTVTADKLAQGYTAHDASGQSIVGTMSGGGGSVTQDQDGYIVLPSTGGDTPTPSGGFEYETGTWTPTTDVTSANITFSNTHTVPPYLFLLSSDADFGNLATSAIGVTYMNWTRVMGVTPTTGSTGQYGVVAAVYTPNSAPVTTANRVIYSLTTADTDSAASGTANSRYWVTETGFHIEAYNRDFTSTVSYKWIAVWAPTS